jgi:hypothetical protein
MRVEVLTVVKMSILVFWVVRPFVFQSPDDEGSMFP